MEVSMKKDFLLAIKLMKYGLSVKLELSLGLICLIAGILIDIKSKGSTYIGGFYISLSCLFLFQLIMSMDISTLVQSSAYKRKIQVVLPYLFAVPAILLAFTLIIILHISFIHSGVEGYSASENFMIQTNYILLLSIVLGIVMIYFGFCYKYFVASSVILVVVISAAMLIANTEVFRSICQSLPLTIVVSYLILIAGIALSCLFSALLYRKKLSRIAFSGFNKKAMH